MNEVVMSFQTSSHTDFSRTSIEPRALTVCHRSETRLGLQEAWISSAHRKWPARRPWWKRFGSVGREDVQRTRLSVDSEDDDSMEGYIAVNETRAQHSQLSVVCNNEMPYKNMIEENKRNETRT